MSSVGKVTTCSDIRYIVVVYQSELWGVFDDTFYSAVLLQPWRDGAGGYHPPGHWVRDKPISNLPRRKKMTEKRLRALKDKYPDIRIVWHVLAGWTFWTGYRYTKRKVGVFKTYDNIAMWNMCLKVGIPVKDNNQ